MVIGTRKGSRKAQTSGGRGPITAAFNPTSLVNGFSGGFWRADMGVSLSGSDVTAWADQSTNGNNLSNVTSTPTYSATGFNTSFPGITMTTTEAVYASSFPFNSDTMSAWLLCILTFANSFGRMIALYDTGAGSDFTNPSVEGDSGNVAPSYAWEMHSSTTLGNGGSAVSVSGNIPLMLGCVCNGTDGNLYLGSAAQGSAVSFTSTIGNSTAADNGLYLGNTPTSTGAGWVIAYALLTSKAMNSTDISNLKTWTNTNWGTSF